MPLELEGRTALVTGGSKGIGRAIARSFARHGANVVVTSRSNTSPEDGITAITADATDSEATRRAVAMTAERFGGLDILVNNVGGVEKIRGFLDLQKEDWIEAFEQNVMSVVHAVQHALPLLKKSRHGRVINISSITGVEPGMLVPHYCATKAAVINLSKHLANALASDQILVNVVCPGQVLTEARGKLAEFMAETEGLSIAAAIEKIDTQGASRIPLGRIGAADDIAELVTFLASDRASWVTGSCLHIDGGKLRSAF